ncbi:NAD(+) synthase [Tepidimicrobium xylanilyticum]|uniref:NH(3)-dependent NAD(+) synthetase n=1 Tax=Tepidimicrobium xylanilyticum TaxID=1123352 RepID=A0A1H2STA4_9FIRM|nr:NAD(+) synthase [Tepidimicrobium xylanilyticum]GMG96123.1 NAD(+) synthetase [Tepidimicrobium xylanilyticum]SDW34866.1 NAD+ synthase [Tepidimicrobium xylanilyticum]
MEKIEKICQDIVEWLRVMVNNAGGKGLVFGLSGGIDSAVVAGLSKRAFPESSLGIIMPCHSNPEDEEHGLLVAKVLNLEIERVDLSKTFDELVEAVNLTNPSKLALANIKPRLRMTTLYYFAQNYNYLVVGSSNRSEFAIGYFTKHGDSGVDLLPLASFVKGEIYQMAEFLNIPREIIEKPPSAGLWENQKDEDEMGFGYDVLDNYILNKTGPTEIVRKIERMSQNSQHKRKYPPIFIPKFD